MEDAVQKLWKDRKCLAGWLAAALLLLWIIWMPLVCSSNYRFDSERMLYDAEGVLEQYQSEGRFGLVWLMRLMGLDSWHPVRSGLLFLVFFSLAGLVICLGLNRIAEGRLNRGSALLLLLYGTCPILAYHLYFTLQIAPVGLAMLLAAGTAWSDARMITERPASVWQAVLRHAVSLVLLVLVMSVYQALIVFYAAVLGIFLFCDNQSRHRKHGWIRLWITAVRVLLSLAVYILASGLGRHAGYHYIQYQIKWGMEPLLDCLMNIGIEGGKMLVPIHSACLTVFPAAVCMMLYRLIRTKDRGTVRGQAWLYAILLLVLPLAMSILVGNRTVPRMQFSLPVIAAFLAVFCGTEAGKHKKLLCVLGCIMIVLQTALVVRLQHTDNMRNRFDTEIRDQIIADLDGRGEDGKPIVFIGSRSFTDDSLLMEKQDVYGLSFFEWVYTPERPGSATPAAIRLLCTYSGIPYQAVTQTAKMQEAGELAAEAPAYPAEGYILETDDMIIIKLSD